MSTTALVLSESIEEQIKIIVEANGAIKAVDLTLKVMENLHPSEFRNRDIIQVLERMVTRREITEVEYILPHSDYRVKSIYFPKGTIVKCL